MTRMLLAGLLLCALGALGACDVFTDSATRLAFDIERGIGGLGRRDGDEYIIVHRPTLRTPGGDGRVRVQLDKVGALIVWYTAADGTVLESGATSFHSRFVDTPQTWIVERAEGMEFAIRVQRRSGRAVIIGVD